MLAAGLSLTACGSGDSGGSPNEPGESGAGGDAEPGGGSSSGANGGEGAGGSGANGGDGPGPNGGSAGDDGAPDLEPGDDGPGYEGVDLDGLDATTPPEGCVGGFDASAGSLALALDATVPVAVIQVVDGVVHVNQTACASAAGDPATAELVQALQITGSDADESVYVDAGVAFGAGLYSADGGIVIDLGGGADRVAVLGSDAADDVSAGSSAGAVVIDFSGDGEPDVSATSVESLLVSTGPETDSIRCDGARLGVDPLDVPAELYGSGNNDVLVGGAASDRLFGGIGNDSLGAGAEPGGADVYDGGDGADRVDFSRRTAAVTVTLAGGADDGEDGEGDDVLPSVEDVIGSQGANTLTGSDFVNHLQGGGGDDTIHGGVGSDTLVGGDGDDALFGEDGDDQVYGELGDDELRGGAGDDIVDGLDGRDVIDGGLGDGDICSFTNEDTVSACEL